MVSAAQCSQGARSGGISGISPTGSRIRNESWHWSSGTWFSLRSTQMDRSRKALGTLTGRFLIKELICASFPSRRRITPPLDLVIQPVNPASAVIFQKYARKPPVWTAPFNSNVTQFFIVDIQCFRDMQQKLRGKAPAPAPEFRNSKQRPSRNW